MGKDFNQFTAVGRLGSDPEMSYTNTGTAIVKFNIANGNDYYDKESKAWVERTNWIPVIMFGKYAEGVAERYHKGDKVLVSCEVSVDKYTDKSGEKRTGYSFKANTVQMLEKSNKDNSGGSSYEPDVSAEEDTPWD